MSYLILNLADLKSDKEKIPSLSVSTLQSYRLYLKT